MISFDAVLKTSSSLKLYRSRIAIIIQPIWMIPMRRLAGKRSGGWDGATLGSDAQLAGNIFSCSGGSNLNQLELEDGARCLGITIEIRQCLMQLITADKKSKSVSGPSRVWVRRADKMALLVDFVVIICLPSLRNPSDGTTPVPVSHGSMKRTLIVTNLGWRPQARYCPLGKVLASSIDGEEA